MSRFSMAPREGHLDAMKRVFGYLMKFPKGKIVVNLNYHDHSGITVKDFDNWKDFYPDAGQELPPDMPDAFGKKA